MPHGLDDILGRAVTAVRWGGIISVGVGGTHDEGLRPASLPQNLLWTSTLGADIGVSGPARVGQHRDRGSLHGLPPAPTNGSDVQRRAECPQGLDVGPIIWPAGRVAGGGATKASEGDVLHLTSSA